MMNSKELAKLVKSHPDLRKIVSEANLPMSAINQMIAEEVLSEEEPKDLETDVLKMAIRAINKKLESDLYPDEKERLEFDKERYEAELKSREDSPASSESPSKALEKVAEFASSINEAIGYLALVAAVVPGGQGFAAALKGAQVPTAIASSIINIASNGDVSKALQELIEIIPIDKIPGFEKLLPFARGAFSLAGKEISKEALTGVTEQAIKTAVSGLVAGDYDLPEGWTRDSIINKLPDPLAAVAKTLMSQSPETNQPESEDTPSENFSEEEIKQIEGILTRLAAVLIKNNILSESLNVLLNAFDKTKTDKGSIIKDLALSESETALLDRYLNAKGNLEKVKARFNNPEYMNPIRQQIEAETAASEKSEEEPEDKPEPEAEPEKSDEKEEFAGDFDVEEFRTAYQTFVDEFMTAKLLKRQSEVFAGVYNLINKFRKVTQQEFGQDQKALNEADYSDIKLRSANLFLQRTEDIIKVLDIYKEVAEGGKIGSKKLYRQYRGKLGGDAGDPKKVLYKLLLKDSVRLANAFITKIESLGVTINEQKDPSEMSIKEKIAMVRNSYNIVSQEGSDLIKKYTNDTDDTTQDFRGAKAAATNIWEALVAIRSFFPKISPFKTEDGFEAVEVTFKEHVKPIRNLLASIAGTENWEDVDKITLERIGELFENYVKMIKLTFAGEYTARTSGAITPAGEQAVQQGEAEPPPEAAAPPEQPEDPAPPASDELDGNEEEKSFSLPSNFSNQRPDGKGMGASIPTYRDILLDPINLKALKAALLGPVQTIREQEENPWIQDREDKTKLGMPKSWKLIKQRLRRVIRNQQPSVNLFQRINQITAAYKELYNYDKGTTFKKYINYAKDYKEPAEEPIQERLTRLITPLVKNALKGDSHGQKELHH